MPKSALPLSDKEINAASFIFYPWYPIIGQIQVLLCNAQFYFCRAGSGTHEKRRLGLEFLLDLAR